MILLRAILFLSLFLSCGSRQEGETHKPNNAEEDMLSSMETVLHRTITPQFIPDELFAGHLREVGKTEVFIQTLLTMFRHYNESLFL